MNDVLPSARMKAFIETNLGTERRVLVDITEIAAVQENEPVGATTVILRSGAAFEVGEAYDSIIARMRQAIDARPPQ